LSHFMGRPLVPHHMGFRLEVYAKTKKKLARDKHSSLFCHNVGNGGKMFYTIDNRRTLGDSRRFSSHHRQSKRFSSEARRRRRRRRRRKRRERRRRQLSRPLYRKFRCRCYKSFLSSPLSLELSKLEWL
jgi:hypothetical protein